jgi:acetate---CoA ligase (ADP-forming)
MSTASLRPFLAPRSIAILGASQDPNKVGGRPLHYLKHYGFKGPIYPINPGRPEVQGLTSYKDMASLPEVPDLAIIAVAGDQAIEAIEDCARRGVKGAICITSGFGETSDPEGKAKEQRMVTAARAGGMRMVGPNTQGLANFSNGVVASFSTFFTIMQPKDGAIAMVSQSGAMSALPIGLLNERGLGVRYSLATGNDADVSVLEMAKAAAEDPAIKLLLLYIEGLPRPDQLADLAETAHRNGVFIVALKSGRTPAGQRAALSHTGALANEDRVVDAALKRVGIWRAKDTASLISAAEMYLKGWTPTGRRFVTISGSGATGVMSADAATFAGLDMVQFDVPTRAALDKILPSFASAANPIDLTAALLSNNGLLGEILPVIATQARADCFKVDFPVSGPGYDLPRFARDVGGFARATGKPVVVAAWQPHVAAEFRKEGAAVFPLEAEAIDALAQFVAHHELVAAAKARPRPDWPAPDAGGTADSAGRALNEAESLALLAKAGIPVVKYAVCHSETEAESAWKKISGPVVVKGCSADITHKSELGLVRLKLDSAEAVRAAYSDMEAIIKKEGARFDGVIVAAMAGGRRELMIGAHRDPVFGPVVVVGEGGKYVEAMPDLQLLIPPFTAGDVKSALAQLRCGPVLAGVRGEPPMDVDAFAQAAVAVGKLMASANPRVLSLDLNPVLIDTKGCMAVDAVAIVV